MKRYLSCILFSLFFLPVSATHIVGGDMFYEYLGNDQYRVVLNVYRDCLTGVSGFDNIAHVGVYNGSSLVTTLEMPLSNATVTELPAGTGDPCLIPPAVCVEEAIYDEIFEIPYEAGMLTLVWQRCCRNTTLVNCDSNDDLGITITTQIPDRMVWGDNSSPDFINFPPIIICHSEPFVFDHSAFDPDGDSLVYKFCNPLLGPFQFGVITNPTAPPYDELIFLPGYSFDYPLDAAPAFGIDFESGLLTGTPTQLGQFVFGICVEEYRNGNLMTSSNRDFQFNIAFCSNEFNAVIAEEDPCQGLDITFGNDSSGDIWSWDFGDLTLDSDTSNIFEPEYSFPDSGAYMVTLVVNPGFDCADTTTMEILAYESFDASMTIVDDWCDLAISYYDFNAEGNYTSDATYDWTFEGGEPGEADDSNPDPVWWNTPGSYDITLVINDHFCEDDTTFSVDIIPPPLAIIEEQTVFCDGLTVDFNNLSINASEFVWDFGEPGIDDISLEENPSHTYGDYGTYQVLLLADPETDCEHMDTVLFVLNPPDPIDFDFAVSAPDICDTTNFVIGSFNGTGADNVWWEMGDGTTLQGTQIEYFYEESGQYTITCYAEHEFCDYQEDESIDVSYGLQPIDRPVLVPNVFSPNNDGKNDRFRLFYAGESDIPNLYPEGFNIYDMLESYSIKIYNRWGVLMHDSASDGGIWDGVYKNDEVADGTYYYIITWQRSCLDSSVTTQTGEVEVLRK